MTSYINPKFYDLIKGPILTEKSAHLSVDGYSCLFVDANATKPEIIVALEAIYGVEISQIKTVKYKPQVFRKWQRKRGMFKAYKKAYVKLKDGSVIDFEKVS